MKLELYYDPDGECPNDWGTWKLVSFNNRHINYEDPYKYIAKVDDCGEVIGANVGIRRKLQYGTAFILSYYEHGSGHWSLKGEGTNCPWDTSQYGGILIWVGGKKYMPHPNKRAEFARQFLEFYNDWANGQIFGFSIEEEGEGEESESHGGWFGHDLDSMFEAIQFYTKGKKEEDIEVTGDAKDLVAYHDIISKNQKAA